MTGKKRQHDGRLKARVALEAIRGEKSLAEIASFYRVHGSQITRWKKRALEGLEEIFSNSHEKASYEAQELQEELYKEIGRLKVELEWLKKKSGLGY